MSASTMDPTPAFPDPQSNPDRFLGYLNAEGLDLGVEAFTHYLGRPKRSETARIDEKSTEAWGNQMDLLVVRSSLNVFY